MKPKSLFIRDIIRRDKRQCERLFIPLQIFYAHQPSKANPSPGWEGPYALDNISGSGLSFKIKEQLSEGENLNIRIQYAPQEEPIAMIGRVIRCPLDLEEEGTSRKGRQSKEYMLGMLIYKTKKNDRRKFVNFISDNILIKYTEK